MLQVRPATIADRDRVTEIALACDPEDWLPESYDSFHQGELNGLLVAEQAGRVIGCFAYEWHPDRRQAYMMGMRIDPAAQGQGVGSAFCKAQIDWLTAAGAQQLTLISEHQNERAHRTVERNGFVKTMPWIVYEMPLSDLLGLQTAPRAPLTPELRQWWADQTTGQYAALPDGRWTIFSLTAGDWAGSAILHLGTEGALLWGQEGDEWTVRWASGSPSALRILIATFAQMAREAGIERIAISVRGQLESLLHEAGLPLPDPWRGYLFVYTSQPLG